MLFLRLATSLLALCTTSSSAYDGASYDSGLLVSSGGESSTGALRTKNNQVPLDIDSTAAVSRDKEEKVRLASSTRLLLDPRSLNASRFLEGDGDEHDGHDDHDDEEPASSKPWGVVILGTMVVNLATLIGVILLIPMFKSSLNGNDTPSRSVDILIPAFAAGALIATVMFLTLPEGITKIQMSLMVEDDADHIDDHDGHEDEVTSGGAGRFLRFLEGDDTDHEDHGFELFPSTIWRFTTSLLSGFLLPICLAMFFPKPELPVGASKEEFHDDDSVKDEEQESPGEIFGKDKLTKPIDITLILSILIGDFCHNFTDGVFIGTAFMLSDSTKAWVITTVTLYHELAQELADYFILTRSAGLTPRTALVLNFIAGLSVLLGGIVILAGDFGDMAIGVFMSIASGTYLYIGTVECLTRATAAANDSKAYLLLLGFFAVGVVPVGLTMLNHKHCEESQS